MEPSLKEIIKKFPDGEYLISELPEFIDVTNLRLGDTRRYDRPPEFFLDVWFQPVTFYDVIKISEDKVNVRGTTVIKTFG